jgi:hypothetical protein
MTEVASSAGAQACHGIKFMDILFEIRLMIYDELLVRSEPIRFEYEYEIDAVSGFQTGVQELRARHTRLTKTLFLAILRIFASKYTRRRCRSSTGRMLSCWKLVTDRVRVGMRTTFWTVSAKITRCD